MSGGCPLYQAENGIIMRADGCSPFGTTNYLLGAPLLTGSNAFTLPWGIDRTGKVNVAVTSPAAGGGPFAAGAASNITVSVTGLTTAADAVSSAIVVNTTNVTANSRIFASVISYAGTYGTNGVPLVCLGAIVAGTSFSFQIVNVGTRALSGAIGIAFKIEN